MSAFAEAFRVLRSAIRHSDGQGKLSVVAVTSALPNEGKTTVALCTARAAALAGQRVILVDCDVRLHNIGKLLSLETEAGVVEVLTQGKDWRSCVVNDPQSAANLLIVRQNSFTPQDIFASEAMDKLLKELRAQYDLVVLDCPPVLALADACTLAEKADGVVMIANSGQTPARAVRNAVRQIDKAGGRMLGLVLNGVEASRRSYGDSLYYERAQKYYFVA